MVKYMESIIKELCETMHMSYQEFYNVKLSLEEKDL